MKEMYLKALGLHDYTLKNLMYENNFCKFYDAVDENDTSYVLKFIPSNTQSDEDPFPFIDCFQVEEGMFLYMLQTTLQKKAQITLRMVVVVVVVVVRRISVFQVHRVNCNLSK